MSRSASVERRLVAAAVALTVLVGILATYGSFETRAADAALSGRARVGALAPDFVLTALDGSTVRLSDLRGRPVVVNFWATWCPPCRAEMPEFDVFHRDRPDVPLLAVDVQEDASAVQGFQRELGLALPLLLDGDGGVWSAYQTRGLPSTYLIDRDGVVRDINVGPLNRDLLERKLARLP